MVIIGSIIQENPFHPFEGSLAKSYANAAREPAKVIGPRLLALARHLKKGEATYLTKRWADTQRDTKKI
jgi:hypothetical protein